jgi:hypothetical protein
MNDPYSILSHVVVVVVGDVIVIIIIFSFMKSVFVAQLENVEYLKCLGSMINDTTCTVHVKLSPELSWKKQHSTEGPFTGKLDAN